MPWSNSWLPTAEVFRPSAFSTSMVGWSCCSADANSEAPMLSPAETKAVPSGFCARSSSTVPAKFTVLLSMRPWKSLMATRSRSTEPGSVVVPSRSRPTRTGSWSEDRNGVSS